MGQLIWTSMHSYWVQEVDNNYEQLPGFPRKLHETMIFSIIG